MAGILSGMVFGFDGRGGALKPMGCVYRVARARAESYELSEVKRAVDALFFQLGYHPHNPLGHIITPGMTVFIKPNWVASRWRESCPHKDTLYSVITHPNLVEVIADYAAVALEGRGKIIIGDNPSIDADFNELMQVLNLEHLKGKYNVPCEILDLRPLICRDLHYYGQKSKMDAGSGDPLGQETINLGRRSLLYSVNPLLFRGVFKQRKETIKAHTKDNQLYGFSKSIYDADVYISLPKMKTHHKVGVTLNLKGLVGAITEKNHLVHWRVGFPAMGGDEYPDFKSWVRGSLAKVKERGAWSGNDTIWRMVVDLYHGMEMKKRGYFTVVDGIIGGEGKGPFCVHSKHSGMLVAGESLLAVDLTAVKLMGLNPRRIPYLNYFLEHEIALDEIEVSDEAKQMLTADQITGKQLDYRPSERWKELREDGQWLS